MHTDAGEEGGREFSSKMPRTMSNLPDFPRCPFLHAHLCFYTKSMAYIEDCDLWTTKEVRQIGRAGHSLFLSRFANC